MARYTYVISDIHGQFDALMKMMERIDFSYDDEMYVLGDIIDRGNQSLECVQWIMEQDNILAMLGNHELMFLEDYQHNYPGFFNTIVEARERLSDGEIKKIADWISDMPECKLINIKGRHFYLNHTQAVSTDYFNQTLTDRMFPDYDRYKKYYHYDTKDVISIFGHIPTLRMRRWNLQKSSNKIWKNATGNVIDIDCGAGYPEHGGCLGCMRLNDMKEYYVKL